MNFFFNSKVEQMTFKPHKMKMNYKLIEAESKEEFTALLNAAFQDGWRLGVGTSITDGEIRPDVYSLTLVRDLVLLN